MRMAASFIAIGGTAFNLPDKNVPKGKRKKKAFFLPPYWIFFFVIPKIVVARRRNNAVLDDVWRHYERILLLLNSDGPSIGRPFSFGFPNILSLFLSVFSFLDPPPKASQFSNSH